ncbi:MAG TPA: hypothetical protein VME92_19315 [Acetobacteraceae bacterium]|nr:hypothetical protein [Acetobacteraceae bacterium]
MASVTLLQDAKCPQCGALLVLIVRPDEASKVVCVDCRLGAPAETPRHMMSAFAADSITPAEQRTIREAVPDVDRRRGRFVPD